jgi:hypothetical protein
MFRNNYDEYNSYLKSVFFKLKFHDIEVSQGLCIIKEKIYITCYKIDNTTSCVIEFDMNGNRLRTIDLHNRSHVGGISYDEKHNLVFICDTNGKVSSYSYNSFEKKKSFEIANTKGEKLIEKNKLVCSYLTCFDNKLFVGSFNLRSSGVVKVFDITREENGISLNYKYDFKVPKKTQGLTFYNKDDKTYLFISKSYGRKSSSNINIYLFDYEKREYLSKDKIIKIPPMLEQITTLEDELVLLFESSSFKYRDTCKYIVDELVSLDIKKILD